jgi:hypothetical protein
MVGGEMNNKLVAWMDKESNITMIGGIYPKKLEEYLSNLEARIVALESHPVKELTDEEIQEVFYGLEVGHSLNDFTRAILRKAQEK